MILRPPIALWTATAAPAFGQPDTRSIAIPKNGRISRGVTSPTHRPPHRQPLLSDQGGLLMPVLFWICRNEEEERWLVVAAGNVYGEYLNAELAVLDRFGK